MEITASDERIESTLNRIETEWDGKSDWIPGGYATCEKAAFDLLFGKDDHWEILYKKRENDYQGSTYIVLKAGRTRENADNKGWAAYQCEYSWGSCGGCDTLEGSGPVEAVKMIARNITTVFEDEYD